MQQKVGALVEDIGLLIVLSCKCGDMHDRQAVPSIIQDAHVSIGVVPVYN